MGSEYFINSQELENKVRDLLPSQGGAGAGFDLSASTQIIPIIDLTESAEGSNLRQDLQTSFSFDTSTVFDIRNTSATIINTTGFYRVFGNYSTFNGNTSFFALSDGVADKIIWNAVLDTSQFASVNFDFIVKLDAGDLLKASSNSASGALTGAHKQIASIDGTLN